MLFGEVVEVVVFDCMWVGVKYIVFENVLFGLNLKKWLQFKIENKISLSYDFIFLRLKFESDEYQCGMFVGYYVYL